MSYILGDMCFWLTVVRSQLTEELYMKGEQLIIIQHSFRVYDLQKIHYLMPSSLKHFSVCIINKSIYIDHLNNTLIYLFSYSNTLNYQ